MKNFWSSTAYSNFIKIAVLFFISYTTVNAQSTQCNNCAASRTYIPAAGTMSEPHKVSNTNNNWNGGNSPGTTDIARFDKSGYYLWEASGNNPVTIKGIILESGAHLEIGRFNNNETPAFDIIGGCIVVKANATLHFSYYTKLKDVTICVQDGGKILFDSEAQGNSSGQRDDFVFNNITIVLAPNAEVKFGNAEIIQIGATVIQGYNGTGCTRNQDGSLTPPPSPPANINVDLTRMTQSELSLFCGFLANAGFSILPVEWLYVKSHFNSTERSSTINWATSKEWENSHFEIERSINGISNWEKVGEVQGMGWTDEKTEYSFCDEKLPIGGGNVYYRLKQVDFNLKFEYSKTVTVKVPPLQITKGKWRVYPNPVNDVNFYIARTELEEISSISVKVLSSNEQMRSTIVSNERELTEAVKKGFDKLPKGVFIVEIQWNQKVEYLKVLKN